MTNQNSENKTEVLGLKINNRLLRRLQKHIASSNFSQHQDLSQQDWLKAAIAEKLEKEKAQGPLNRNSLKQVTIRLEKELKGLLDQRIEALRQESGRSNAYSKKSWILEAIEEKLEREESLL